jgi:hypothetical protein
MSRRLPAYLFTIVVAASCIAPVSRVSAQQAASSSAIAQAERDAAGLWAYESLGRDGAAFTELRGLFIFSNGWFVQQSLNEGGPFERQVAQAHSGPYRADGDKFYMTARVGVVVSPDRDPAVQSRKDSEHVVTVRRAGEKMDLVFSSGTIQKFHRRGPGRGRVYPLERGGLALVDGHFILVAEVGEASRAGSGAYEQRGNVLRLTTDRWFSAQGGKATYTRGPMEATFDGRALSLPDGFIVKVASPPGR